MKLLNQSLKHLSISMLVIVSLWSVVFYVVMISEIKESIDEGLENYKRIIVFNATTDSTVLSKTDFDAANYTVQAIGKDAALRVKDSYIDTIIYMQDADDEAPELEPVRLFTTAFENNGSYYQLRIINSMMEEDDLKEDLFWAVLALYLILVVSIIAINNVLLRRLWKPFYNLLNQLTSYRLGSGHKFPTVETDTKEFKDLQAAVNTLLQHGTESYEQQKQFIENASHELQTPLAISINKMELLLEKGNIPDAEATQLGEILESIERLTRLNKSLLLLSKIDNKQYLNNQPVTLNDVVKQVATQLEDLAEYKQVSISIDESATLIIHIDPALANIIISNLLKNAITYNVQGGNIHVVIATHQVSVSNTGSTEALDAARIFNRFYKAHNNSKGTGLGLAIVKAISQLYGHTLSYSFTEGRHLFRIAFKTR
ncbi:MAG: HAMP domain-containing histidine kinase [Bacteroidetes bacterium]|nr:HAMP domain-containing histidine kinase [Bacteroidota bacterium]